MRISREHLASKCKLGFGSQCCSYLGMGPNGFVCLKCSKLRKEIDRRKKEGELKAMGDNCPGLREIRE